MLMLARALAVVPMRVAELSSAVLLVFASLVLLAGVVFRYALQSPLTWSDELASVVFVWLSMMGSVVASGRVQHMRLTGLVSRLPLRLRDAVAAALLLGEVIVLALLVAPALDNAGDEAFVTSAALEVSMYWKGLALPAGLVMMLLLALSRLLAPHGWSALLGGAGICAAFAAVALLGLVVDDLGNYALFLYFVVVAGGAVLLGFPIALAFLLGTLAYITLGIDGPPSVVAARMESGMGSMLLLSIPLFVLLGALLELAGMARAMIDFLAALVGPLRGGLNYVLIAAMFLLSGISGCKSADMAAVAPALLPEMRRRGYAPGEVVALLTATGVQTETIPPSLVLIAVGSVTGVSIAALFAGGLLPALFMGLLLVAAVFIRTRGAKAAGRWPPPAALLRLFLVAMPALVLPVLIRSAVVEGIATATEVATLGIVYALLFAAVRHRTTGGRLLAELWRALVASAALSGAIMLILGGVTGMAFALTQSGFSASLAEAVSALPGGRWSFLAGSVILFVVLGTVLEGLPAMVLFAPLLFPVAGSLGINQVHYAVVTILAMGIGLYLPPFGVGYYIACAISKVEPQAGLRPLFTYLAVLFVGLAIVAAVPAITTVAL